MKSFTILCCIFLFSAFVFAARAEESNETPAEEEEQADLAVNDEEQEETTEENDEETENNEDESVEDQEEDEEEDEEKRSGYGRLVCPKKCRKVCKPKFCASRVCKRFRCDRKVCEKVVRYRIVKKSFKVNVGDLYYPKIVLKYKTYKAPYTATVCKKVPKYCKRCRVVKRNCGKLCRTVCKKVKCVPAYY